MTTKKKAPAKKAVEAKADDETPRLAKRPRYTQGKAKPVRAD